MLMVLMYHRVTETASPSQLRSFEKHLIHLVQNYPIVVPGDTLDNKKINICLTFDDAYFDFYHVVFPLLQQLNTRALLAIPSGLILEDTQIDSETRLAIPYRHALNAHQTHATLCTWKEINEMVSTDLVIPAAHGLTHHALTELEGSFEQEVIYAKVFLQEKVQREIETFIYPYGRMTRKINQLINDHYRYAMRIGSALNVNWQNAHRVIYRVNAEDFWIKDKALVTTAQKLSLGLRFLSNTMRFK